MATEAFVYDAIRTPRGRGKKNGSLHEVKPVDLVVGLLDELRERNPALDPARVDDVVLGVVTPDRRPGRRHRQDGGARGRATRRPSAGVQLNRFCASRPRGRQPGRRAGPLRLGGPDPRRRRRVDVPGADGLRRRRLGHGPGDRVRHRLRAAGHRRRPDRHPRGLQPRRTSTRTPPSRRHRAAKAEANGYFDRSVVPVKDRNGLTVLDHDEFIRPGTTVESLAGLKPSLRAASATTAASTRSRWRSTTGSSRSTTSTTPATPRASSTAPRWSRSATRRSATDHGLTPARPDRRRPPSPAPTRRSC